MLGRHLGDVPKALVWGLETKESRNRVLQSIKVTPRALELGNLESQVGI